MVTSATCFPQQTREPSGAKVTTGGCRIMHGERPPSALRLDNAMTARAQWGGA